LFILFTELGDNYVGIVVQKRNTISVEGLPGTLRPKGFSYAPTTVTTLYNE